MTQLSAENPLVLHIWPGKWNLSSIDPSCLAAVLYLQLTVPGKFLVEECTNPDLSPSGQLPFLTHEHHVLPTLPSIVKFVSGLRIQKEDGQTSSTQNIDSNLSATEKSQRTAWVAHVESNMGDLVAHMFYSLHDNWIGLMLPALASLLPIPQRYYVPERLRDLHKPRLEASGLWNLPGIEQEKQPAWDDKKQPQADPKEKYARVFGREKVLEKATAILDKYQRLLGDNEFFYHNRPTTLDVILAAYTLLLTEAPFPDPLLQNLITSSYPSLVRHARLVQERAFLSSGATLRSMPSQKYNLRSLVPGVSGNQANGKNKPLEKTAEELRFDRMRLGWILLATTAVLISLLTTFTVTLVSDSSDDEESEEDEPEEPAVNAGDDELVEEEDVEEEDVEEEEDE